MLLTPPTLGPGQQYRLVFTTASTYTATSGDIATYNNDVNTEADSITLLNSLGTTWTAIGSTSSVSAIVNIGLSDSSDDNIPIYNLMTSLWPGWRHPPMPARNIQWQHTSSDQRRRVGSHLQRQRLDGDTKVMALPTWSAQVGSSIWGYTFSTDSTLIANSVQLFR